MLASDRTHGSEAVTMICPSNLKGHERILIVEADVALRRGLIQALDAAGYDTVAAARGTHRIPLCAIKPMIVQSESTSGTCDRSKQGRAASSRSARTPSALGPEADVPSF